jgi:hypothetical protein
VFVDELISIFIDSHFSEEFQEEINRSFGLIEFFDYKDAYSGFVDILTNEANHSGSDMQDMFTAELNKKLDYMLSEHQLQLVPEATVFQKNEILLALAHVQNLENYTGIIAVLESLESDELKTALILSDLSTLDESTVLSLVAKINPRTLQALKDYIYAKEKAQEQNGLLDNKLLANFILFTKLYGQATLGAGLLSSGMMAAQRFHIYLGFVESEVVVKDDEQTALNIMSLIYLSEDGFNSPLLVYHKYSYRLLQDLNRVSRIEVKILGIIAKITEHRNAQDEQARISQTSA